MEGLIRRHGSEVALVAALAGLLGLVLLLAPGAAGPEAALARYAGRGVTTTADQHLADGRYAVSWSARAADQPEQGCLFGLRLEERRADATPGYRELRLLYPDNGNLVYRTLPRNGSLVGSSAPLALDGGTYGFVVDGWCAWDVSLSRAPEQASPSANGGPRM